MAKFIYRFESIKKVKENLEKKVQKEVAELKLEIERCEKEYNDILDEGLNQKSNIKKLHYKLSEIQFYRNYEISLNKKLEIIQKKIDQLNRNKDEKIEELKKKSQEKKIFNVLEENHFENFFEEEKKKENSELNEIAVLKFVRENR